MFARPPAPAPAAAAAPVAPVAPQPTWWELLRFKFFILLGATIIMVVIEIPEFLGAPMEKVMAIEPRHPIHLPGVPLHPWLHFGWAHLFSNLFGWWLLGGLLLLGDGIYLFAFLFSCITLFAGLLVWIASPRSNTFHAGMSGVLLGFFSFLAFRVWWQRPFNFKNIGIFVIAALLYGLSVVLTVTSIKSNVSWELHLAGAIGGVLFAYLYFKVRLFKFLETNPPGQTQPNPLAAGQTPPPYAQPAPAAPAAPTNPFAVAAAAPPPSNPFAPGGAYASAPGGAYATANPPPKGATASPFGSNYV